LLRFCFGPEATGVAALSFHFGGMRDRLWRCCPKQTNNTIFDMAYGLALNQNLINYS